MKTIFLFFAILLSGLAGYFVGLKANNNSHSYNKQLKEIRETFAISNEWELREILLSFRYFGSYSIMDSSYKEKLQTLFWMLSKETTDTSSCYLQHIKDYQHFVDNEYTTLYKKIMDNPPPLPILIDTTPTADSLMAGLIKQQNIARLIHRLQPKLWEDDRKLYWGKILFLNADTVFTVPANDTLRIPFQVLHNYIAGYERLTLKSNQFIEKSSADAGVLLLYRTNEKENGKVFKKMIKLEFDIAFEQEIQTVYQQIHYRFSE